MESLPVEMVVRIAQQLTPQDLARCSAVSREWREIFNHDWMWKPHCDPELEEPLRTTTCLATPAFVVPEADNSTLSPNSRWKMAFIREKHLWKNWRREEIMNKKDKIIESENSKTANVEFLTDTLVVVWYSDKIKIVDVSVMPATFVAKADTSVNIDIDVKCSVRGTTMLCVEHRNSIDIFNVDITNKSIELKHNIDLLFHPGGNKYVVNEDVWLYYKDEGPEFLITNPNTGEILKKVPFPVKYPEVVREITGSTTSDFVAVAFCNDDDNAYCNDDDDDDNVYPNIYIFSLKELTFLPGPVAVLSEIAALRDFYSISLHGHWLALTEGNKLKVVNMNTREVLLNYEENLGSDIFIGTRECYNGFVFYFESDEFWVKHYSPSGRTLTTVYESSDLKIFDVIHNKFITIYSYPSLFVESVLKLSDQTVEKCDISVTKGCKINPSCTKVLKIEWLNDSCPWSVIHLW